MTLQPSFQSLVLDHDALSVPMIGRTDVIFDRSDFGNEGYQFVACRQYILYITGIWEGVIGRLCCHVPHAPLGISFPVLMEFTKGINHSEL